MTRDFSLERLAGLPTEGVVHRRDVDADLEAAALMSKTDRDNGVSAIYYLMTRSPYYNLFSGEGHELAYQLLGDGHQLGVHIDLDLPRDAAATDDYVVLRVERELALVAVAFSGIFQRRVSFHCPPASVLWREFPTFDSAYAPIWKGLYYSDSRRQFAYGDPEDDTNRPLQIALHPEHWFCPGGNFLAGRSRQAERSFVPFFGEQPWF